MRSTECDCGAAKAPYAEACDSCIAAETAQGLRKAAPGKLGIPHPAGSVAYHREYRRIKASAGRCSVCTGRPAREGVTPTGKPYRTCAKCSGTWYSRECTEHSGSLLGVCGAKFRTRDPRVRMCQKHRILRRAQESRRRARHLATVASGAYAWLQED